MEGSVGPKLTILRTQAPAETGSNPFHFKGPMILRVYKNHVEILALNFGVDLFWLNICHMFDTHLDARYLTFWYLQFAIDELMVRLFLIVTHSFARSNFLW